VNDAEQFEAHKWKCLAAYVLDLGGLFERRRFLDRFAKNNGQGSADKLKKLMGEEWERRRRK